MEHSVPKLRVCTKFFAKWLCVVRVCMAELGDAGHDWQRSSLSDLQCPMCQSSAAYLFLVCPFGFSSGGSSMMSWQDWAWSKLFGVFGEHWVSSMNTCTSTKRHDSEQCIPSELHQGWVGRPGEVLSSSYSHVSERMKWPAGAVLQMQSAGSKE